MSAPLCGSYDIGVPSLSNSNPARAILGARNIRFAPQTIITKHSQRAMAGSARIAISERKITVKLVEPPSCSPAASAVVFIGRDCRGNWVVREQNGLFGGLFVNHAQALKYALSENGHHPETIVELSREIELDIPMQASEPTRRAVFFRAA